MNRAVASCFAALLACSGCDTSSSGSDGGLDGGTDAGTGGADGGTGGTGGTGGSGGTGGTGGGGSDACDFSSELGVGWSAPPSCDKQTITAGESLTCTQTVIGAQEAGAVLVNRESFFTGGGGYVDAISSDGPIAISIDTQFAEVGDYVVVFDMSSDSTGTDYVSLAFGDTGDDYQLVEFIGENQQLSTLPGCTLITVTIE